MMARTSRRIYSKRRKRSPGKMFAPVMQAAGGSGIAAENPYNTNIKNPYFGLSSTTINPGSGNFNPNSGQNISDTFTPNTNAPGQTTTEQIYGNPSKGSGFVPPVDGSHSHDKKKQSTGNAFDNQASMELQIKREEAKLKQSQGQQSKLIANLQGMPKNPYLGVDSRTNAQKTMNLGNSLQSSGLFGKSGVMSGHLINNMS